MNARPLALLLVLASLAGCSGGAEKNAAPPRREIPVTEPPSPTPSPAPSPTPSCPPFIELRPSLPFGVPGDLPWPSGAIVEKVEREGRGVVVRMRVRRPIADLLAYSLAKLAEEGYEFEGGTLEGEVAEVPFYKGPVRGSVSLRLAGPCDTRFTVAVSG